MSIRQSEIKLQLHKEMDGVELIDFLVFDINLITSGDIPLNDLIVNLALNSSAFNDEDHDIEEIEKFPITLA